MEALRERYSYLYSLPQWRFDEVLQKTVALMRSTGELHAPKVSEENADGDTPTGWRNRQTNNTLNYDREI